VVARLWQRNRFFAGEGLLSHRHTSINEVPIAEADRKFQRSLGQRPDDYPSLSDFGF
jgi:nuclear transport factor 2 (NTF2) superfamily protein